MERLADLLMSKPRLFAVVLLCLLVGSSALLLQRGILFDYSLENFLPQSDPAIQAWRNLCGAVRTR